MSAPPPYPGNEKEGYPPQGGYPSQPQGGYPSQPPPPAGYSQPYGQGYGQGYPAPGGYPQQQQHTTGTTVVVAQPQVTVVQQFREAPVHCRCPHCQAEVVTGTSYETGTFAWVICLVLCLIGCDLGCCLIPFCVDGCKDVTHTCPNCRQVISRWNRM